MTREQRAAHLLRLAPVDWREYAAHILPSEAQQIATVLEARAQQAIRAAAYLTNATYSGCAITDQVHAHAVRKQNIAVRKVRRALGFTYPDAPVSF